MKDFMLFVSHYLLKIKIHCPNGTPFTKIDELSNNSAT